MDWEALALSLRLASATTALLFLFGLPVAYLLARRPGHVSSLLEALFSLPLVLPPTVLGFYLLLGLGPLHLAFTFAGLLIASVLYSLPFAFQPFIAAFQSLDKNLLESSWVLGESSFQTFLRVALPLALPGIVSGLVLTFAHALGEFGVVLMIGGNIPGISRTLSVTIYDHVQAFEYPSANRTAALLLGVSLAALVTTSFLRKRAPALL